MDDPVKCPKCGSANLVTAREGIRLPPGASAKLACGDCGAWIKWLGVPAAEFRMPYGEFEGRTLAEINAVNRSRLEWIAGNAEYRDKKIQAKVREFLEQNPAPGRPPMRGPVQDDPIRPHPGRQQEKGHEPWPEWKDPSWTPPR